MESKEKRCKWTYLENRLTDLENEHMVIIREGWRKVVVREFGMDMSTLLYLTQITNKDLLYSTWNSAQCYGAAWRGEEFGEEWIHVYVWLFCASKANTIFLIVYTPIQNESLKKMNKENNYGCKDKIYSYRQYVEHVLESVILSMGASEPY